MVLDIYVFGKIYYTPLIELKKAQFYSSYKDRIQAQSEKIVVECL